MLSCRTGPLRVGRSVRDGYTGFALALPMVGIKIVCDHREHEPKGYTGHEVTAARAGRTLVGHPFAPARTKVRAASSTCSTEATEQLSQ